MPSNSDDTPPSAWEVRRRIEVGLENAGVNNSAEIATVAAEAIQPLIETLKVHREVVRLSQDFNMTITKLVRVSATSEDLRNGILAALQTLEPWNGEWARLAEMVRNSDSEI
jgi:hypothetical protein